MRDTLNILSAGEELVVDNAWIDEYAAAGNNSQVRARIQALIDAGADSIGLWLFPGDQLPHQLRRFAADVLPSLTT